MEKRVLCYGDSLTWGWNAKSDGSLIERYGRKNRWTGVLARELGDDFHVIEEGLSGRTTDVDDPSDPMLNGATYLSVALATHSPLDLVVVMLGTNDTKAHFKRGAAEIALGIATLVSKILCSKIDSKHQHTIPKVLLVAPPILGQNISNAWITELFSGAYEKSTRLAEQYKNLADHLHVHFFNAGDVIATEGDDGVHFSQRNNEILGMEIANFISNKIFLLNSVGNLPIGGAA